MPGTKSFNDYYSNALDTKTPEKTKETFKDYLDEETIVPVTEGSTAETEIVLKDDAGEIRERRFIKEEEPVLEIDDDKVDEMADKFEEAMDNDEPDAVEKAIDEVKEALTPAKPETGMPAADTLLILEAVNRLIDKIDRMQQQPPVVNVPAPIIEVTLPDIKRTITKTIERNNPDDKLMTKIIEDIEDHNLTEPKAKIVETQKVKRVRKKRKDK